MDTVADVLGLAGSLILAAPFLLTRRRRRQLRGTAGLTARTPAAASRLARAQTRVMRLILELSSWEMRLFSIGSGCLVASFAVKILADLLG